MEVIGHIARRQCVGKNLAFVDLKLQHTAEMDSPSASDTRPLQIEENNINDRCESTSSIYPPADSLTPATPRVKVVQLRFRRNSDEWDADWPENIFPNKNSQLPYGGKLWVQVGEVLPEPERDVTTNDEKKTEENDGKHIPEREKRRTYPVQRWKVLEDPRELALSLSTTGERSSEGILCAKYLKIRGEAYSKFNDNPFVPPANAKTKKEPKEAANRVLKEGTFSHGDKRTKALRAKIFAAWLIETYGTEDLRQGTGVLDVAGGKGKLSIELSLQGHIPSTIVDPLVRKHGAKLDPRDAKRIRKAQAPHPQLISKCFNRTTFLEDSKELLEEASLCVGLHPDECTEDLLDLALEYNKPVALVPCCVFSGFFPLRYLKDGRFVQTYEEFLEYLLSKDERLKRAELSFEGRNIVIYLEQS